MRKRYMCSRDPVHRSLKLTFQGYIGSLLVGIQILRFDPAGNFIDGIFFDTDFLLEAGVISLIQSLIRSQTMAFTSSMI